VPFQTQPSRLMFTVDFKRAFLGLAAALFAQAALALNTGDIAFTGFNGDGNDNLAFVTLANVPAGTVIYFTDEEWTGSDWADFGEAAFYWTATTALPAGTVVTLDNVSNIFGGTATASTGTLTALSDANNNGGIGNSDEGIFAFQGTGAVNANGVPVPTTFLAAIGNDTLANTGSTLTGTGLVEGATALFITGDEDIMAYTGPRAGVLAFSNFRAGINNATNWVTQDAGGDQSADSTAPDVPFSATRFHTYATQLILTEINSNAAGGDFWELTNVGSTSVDIGGWAWDDDSKNPNDAAAVTIASGTSIAAGESVIFTNATSATVFRNNWGTLAGVQVIMGGPGLGGNDGVGLYNAADTEIFYFGYAANNFIRSNGSNSAGGHAGASAGGVDAQSAVLDPGFGTDSGRRYAAATANTFGAYVSTAGGSNIGSPGATGLSTGGGPGITLAVNVTPSTFAESVSHPAAVGTVSRSSSGASDLLVNLSSSDMTEATVPVSVTILAGQTSATFNVTAVDDTFPDGSKTATITATATDANSPTFDVTVQDDGVDVLDASFLLTEIQSQQSAGKPSNAEDYWELTNISGSTKDISGYSWHDGGRSASAAAAYKLPPGTTIAAGESVIFTVMPAADFRTWWGLDSSQKVFTSPGAPGLGQNDGISFFDAGQNELFFFSYAAAGFDRENGTDSLGGHAGPSAGGSADSQALVWVPASGTTTPRYAFATGSTYGTFQSAVGTDLGSPGNQGVEVPTVSIAGGSVTEGNSGTVTLPFTVTRSDTATAFTVGYAVTGGTATSGADYATLSSGTLTFTAAGSATQTINVTVNGDTTAEEQDETIVITLTNVVNTTGATVLGTAAGTGTIINDDVILPVVTTNPASTSIASGGVTTLTVAATGFPTPTYQWYEGNSGVTTNPVSGATSSTFTTPPLTATTSYWARATNTGGSDDSDTATVTVTSGPGSVNLASYVRVGRYSLPRPPVVSLPPGTPAHNLLCEEASGVAYNWDTDTLFVACDGGKSITQVSKTGVLIDTMTLALGSSPQGTDFYDIEGITYIGGGQFVMSEERDRQLVKFTYVAGTTLSRSAAKTVKIGTFVDNTGTEGLCYDPQTGGFICLKEVSPIGIFQTGVDFDAGTATNGAASTVNSTDLFNPSLLGMTDVADVFVLANLPSMVGQPQLGNLLVLGQENARVVNVDRSGTILSTLQIVADPGSPLDAPGQQHEGITMDSAGNIYIVNENGGGSIEVPELWVYAPSSAANQAPTLVTVDNAVTSIVENSSTAAPIKLGDIAVTDDGLGTNALSLTGADASSFQITGTALYSKAGVNLDYETKTSYIVTINVDDTTVGSTPDITLNFTLSVIDQTVETPPAPVVIISEFAPWSSSNSPTIGADWFELTNISPNTIDITGWKVDDDSNSAASAIVLNGVTSIAPGESVIFLESSASNPAGTVVASFKSAWFGSNVPSGLQVGTYQGSGIGLGTGGDALNIFNASGVLQTKVTFGASPGSAPFKTFDNTVGLNNTAVSLLSAVGVHGAFVAASGTNEIGSPGYSEPGNLVVTEVAPWGSGNSPPAVDWFEITNKGARAVSMANWKMDDSSQSPAGAVDLTGINSIAPGESVIYLETNVPNTKRPAFLSLWFGSSPPPSLQVGSYTGDVGLSTGGDAVNLYEVQNVSIAILRTTVSFGGSPSSAPFASFENATGASGALTAKSIAGIRGAFVSSGDANEIGSPGVIASSPGTFGAWLAENGYTSNGLGTDTDSDGLLDFAEYYFNQNPNSDHTSGNTPHLVTNGADLELHFSHLAGVGITGALQTSHNLTNWLPALPGTDYEVISEVDTAGITDVVYRIFTTPVPSPAGPFTYLTPFTTQVSGGSLKGLTVINHGLVGSGRLSGESLDAFGETMGAASGLSITNWSYDSGLNRFSGTFNVLPDRGYNFGAIFSNYAARVHETPFTFTPHYGAGPVTPDQVVPTYVESTKFVYQDGATLKFTTGLNATGTSTILDQTVGTVTTANGPGGSQESLISFDAEAIHVFPDGSGFVSDEYGTYIARFDATKKITKLIQLPASAQPHRPVGTLNFDSIAAPTNGRRNNQGLEGMAVSPDNTRLFALMQSALVQDTNGGNQQTRYNTRLYVYDIAGAKLENPVLVGEYVVQLPRIDLNGDGVALDGTAAQSEIVAISNNQFLMLPRDGNGLGKGTTDPIVTKMVELVDFKEATNVLGLYDAEGNQVSPGGVLLSGIVPASSIRVVNLISSTDLAKFGLNANTTTPNEFTINEKMEGMAIVPDLSTDTPDDYFLFVANDNDFHSPDVQMLDATGNVVSYGDGRLPHPNGRVTNDAVFYVYRLTISSSDRKFFRLDVQSN